MTQHLTESPSNNTANPLLQPVATIAAAYINKQGCAPEELDALLAKIYGALKNLECTGSKNVSVMEPSGKTATISIDDSIQSDYIICLEDGKKLKMLKRYLKTNYNLTPEQYRKRWNLPSTYPMVAPEYAQRRSQLAKDIGLGTEATRLTRMQVAANNRRAANAMLSDA